MSNNKGTGTKPKRGRNKISAYYIVLGAIAVLLLLITAFLEIKSNRIEYQSPQADGTELSGLEPEEVPHHPDILSVPEYSEVTGSSALISEKPGFKSRGSLIFVIDDVGNSLDQLDAFLKIPGPLVFAVMPNRKYTKESVKRIKAAGKMVIIHQPMEPVGSSNPGKGAIYADMEENEIIKTLDDNLASTGPAPGLNNHMGSKVTTDPGTMRIIMKYLKDRGMFFLDSVTNTNLVGSEIAREIGIPYVKRNSMFLDNESDRESVLAAIKEGQKAAEKNGHAVMIGHVMTKDLAELLIELYPTFMEDGFTLKDLSDLLHGEYDVSAWD